MYLLQIWFNLSDEGLEDAIYDSYAMRNFVGINFLEEQVPDATTAFGWWPFFVSICIVCFLIISRILHINPLKEGEGDIIFHCGKEKIKIHVIVTQEAFVQKDQMTISLAWIDRSGGCHPAAYDGKARGGA
jgi:hypothetical protein